MTKSINSQAHTNTDVLRHHVTEGISSQQHYHLSLVGINGKALCGSDTMATSVPMSAWGVSGELREHWCADCKAIADAANSLPGGPLIPRTIPEIRRTAWARRFKRGCPDQYEDAVRIAFDTGPVTIEQRDDHSSKGDFVWAIISDAYPAFWLDGLATKDKAIDVCRKMGWEVRAIKEDSSAC